MPSIAGETTVSGEATLPYYNAGFVVVPSNVDFGRVLLEMCLAIDADPQVKNKRPWLDQIALPLVVQKLNLEVGLLGETHNFPLHLRPIDESDRPVFCHYHSPRQLLKSRSTVSALRRIALEHPYIWDLMEQQSDWRQVAKLDRAPLRQRISHAPGLWYMLQLRDWLGEMYHKGRTRKAELERNAIVTGFPRSGTSLYSTLLNSIPNVVCLNEISFTDNTFSFYRRIRARVTAGLPVTNKYSGSGSLTTNTIGGGTQRDGRVIPVEDDQFVLAQKWTLPYLNRLEELCDEGWNVCVLVRHPLYAISSWKRCPPHFGISKIDPPDGPLTHIQFQTSDPDERRVEIWNHYARAIHSLRDRLNIVRYEELVLDPGLELQSFCDSYRLEKPKLTLELKTRNRTDSYRSNEELSELVNGRCEMNLFGDEAEN
ncbi:MAG: sulfotransferase [bacterium]|nr:sulfotransferase [bacterium]